jgi:hypothetical protein
MNPALHAIQSRRRAAQALTTSFAEYDGKVFIGQSQDCTPIAEWAKEQRAIGAIGGRDMRHAARIPNVIIEKYCNENGVRFAEVMRDPVHIKRICNDSANAMFRIWPGRL